MNNEKNNKNKWIKLPEVLSGYRITECLQDCPEKKTYIIEQDGKHFILKYASEKYSVMLHKEKKLSESDYKFSFFPYVINCYDTQEGTYLVREYIKGETLQELVERKGPLDLDEALRFMLKVCDCLIKLHSANPPFIYRDLKAANILFTKFGDCFMLDMGTIRNYQENVSMDTSFMGTSAVAAPEQYGARQTDKRTDVYGFGMLLYYLLTEEIPDSGDGREKFISHPFIKNRKVLSIIRKCTEFDPEKRYPDMAALKKELEKLASYLKEFPEYRKTKRRSIIAAALILSVALTGVLLKITAFSDYRWDAVQNNQIIESFKDQRMNTIREKILLCSDLTSEFLKNDSVISDVSNYDNRDEENSGFVKKEKWNYSETEEDSSGTIGNLDEEVVFDSILLEEAVRKNLGKEKGESIKYSELSDVKYLYICGDKLSDEFDITQWRSPRYNAHGDIEDISLLSYMTDLRILVLEGQKIKDISPIKDLPIVLLSFRDNPISDISALTGNKTLQALDICATDIVSLESLSECSELNVLMCNSADVESFSGLSGLMNLMNVYAEDVKASDYEFLPKNIIEVRLTNVSKEDLTKLSKFQNIQFLFLSCSEIESISEISMFSNAKVLSLAENNISSINGIEEFEELTYLDIGGNYFEDASPLKSLKLLEHLEFSRNNVDNYDFVNELPNLQYMAISASEAAKFYKSVDNPDLTVKINY